MKDYFNRRKSKLLLFTLLAMLAGGVSPAWAQKALPYSYGFEEASCSTSGWTKVNCHSSSENYKLGTSGAYKGDYAFRFYYTSNYPQYLISPELATSSYSLNVSFKYKAHSTSYEESFQVGYSTTDAETSSFTFGDEVKTKSTDWQEYSTTCPAGTKYICIACTSNDKYCLYIDDLVIDSDSPYKTPKAFASTGVTGTTATFSWTAGGDETAWQIAYSTTESFDADAATTINVTTNPYTLEGLTAETTYYARIRADYGSGNYSAWSDEVNFTPGVLTINNTSTTTNSYVPIYGYYMDSKSVCQFVLPKESLTVLNGSQITKIVFYGSINDVSKLESHTFEIYMGEVADATISALADWTTLENVYMGSLTIADGKMTITLADGFDYNGENLLIGLKQTDSGNAYSTTTWTGVSATGASLGGYGSSVSQQNFLPQMSFYYAAQTTTVKKPKNLAASDVATTTAVLSWTDGEEGLSAWEIAYSDNADFAPDTEGTKVTADTNPFTLTELAAATTYYAYVRAKRGEDYSKWSNKVEFTTLAAAPIVELSATALNFGLVSDADAQAQTFTISNTGGVALSNLSVTCDNAAFTITDGEGNALGNTIAAGATLTVKVKMNAVGQQNGTITISGDGVENQTVNLSGYMLDNTKIAETFASLPDRWTAYAYSSGYSTYNWSYSAEGAYNRNENSTLTSPKLSIADSETLTIYAKLQSSASYGYLQVEGSADNGETWTAYTKKLDYEAFGNTTGQYQIITLNDVPTTVNKLRFKSYYAYLNAINGFTYAADPVLALYSDEDCTTTVASEVSKSFGFVTEEQSQSYYIKNTGTGQIDLSASVVDGFDVNITDDALTAGESTAVTITMPATEGTHSAAIVVTATNHDTGEVLGTFTVNASGALRDASKYYADGFAALPSGWTVDGTWYYDAANGAYTQAWYIDPAQGSIARLKTPMLAVADGETIAVEAKGLSTDNTSFQHLQLQYSADGTTWTNLGDEQTLDPSNWKTFMVDGPAEDGNYYIGILASQACVRMYYGGEEVSGANFAINTDGSEQDFGKVAANATAEKSFTVSNNGNATLNVSFAATGDFTVTNPAPSRKFRLTDNLGWGTAYVYAWDSEDNALLGAWPGTVCEKTSNDMYETQFVVAVPNGAVGVVVNNGNGAQTVDITNFTQGYWMDGSKDGSGHYKVEGWFGDGATEETPAVLTVAAGESETFTVAMNTATPGSKSGNVTLSFDALNATSFTIPCTGFVKDPNALAVDFEDNAMPENWQVGDNWTVGSASGNHYAVQGATSLANATALVTTPLTVAEDETLTFKVARNLSGSSSYTKSLKVRYSADGGVNWSDYKDYGDEFGSSFSQYELTGVPHGTVIVEFLGNNIKIDDIEGFVKTTGPVLVLTENNVAVENNSTKDFGNLVGVDGTTSYTITNKGNANLVATLTGTNVNVSTANIDLAPGENAEVTVTLPYEGGNETGLLSITSESWVGDVTINFTATLVDASGFVEDFTDGKPAGWYSEGSSTWDGWVFTNGTASTGASNLKKMITEKVGAEDGKNVLKFDAKTNSGENGTLNVYTSTDRKTWSEAERFSLTSTSQTFTSENTLADGEYYIMFESGNAVIDNVKGLKRLDAPEHDLYEVSTTMAASGTPGAEYTATVVGVSLRADETVTAELWLEKEGNGTKVAYLENQAMTVNTNKTFTLTGNLPTEEGEYEAWVTVKTGDGADDVYFNTDRIEFTLEHTTSLKASNLVAAASSVQADDNNEYTATLNVTLENTGSKTLAASEVSVSITDDHNAEANVYTTKTAAQYVYLYPTDNYTASSAIIAVWNWSNTEDGEWVATTDMGSGLYIAELKEGKTNFSVVRINPDGTDEDAWNNKWNQSDDLSTLAGNVFTFQSWGEGEGAKDNFTGSAFTLAAGETVSLPVSVTGTLTDGESASLSFNAKENVTNTFYHNNYNVTVNITAAPVIVLDETVGTVASQGQNRKVSLKHTFVEGWNTICVPFALNATDIHAEAKALAFTAYNDGTKELTFSPVTELEANKPYVIYVPETISSAIEFTGKTVATNDNLETAFNGVTFQGTYAPVEFSEIDGDQYGLTAAGRIAKASTTATMEGFRAYFDGNLAGARTIFMDESTGIKAIDNSQLTNDNCYNLQGQKVENLKKGNLYIINGKKTVVK